MEIFFLFLGAFIGSFLGVLADRLPRHKGVILGRSHCDHCHKTLKAFDLIPILSFILLKGRCRYCQKKISLKYPLIELASGLAFAYLYLTSANPFLFLLFSVLLVIFVSDWQYLIIPDSMIISALLVILLYKLFYSFQTLPSDLLAGLGASLFLYFIYKITKGRGMGFGDVKLALSIGLFLGFPHIIIAFYLAFLTGALIALILLLLGKIQLKKPIPFGPFLVWALIAVYLWKEKLLLLFTEILF